MSCPLQQVGEINGQLAEICFGTGDPIYHLLFHFQQSAGDEKHHFGHYSLLIPADQAVSCDEQDGFLLPLHVPGVVLSGGS